MRAFSKEIQKQYKKIAEQVVHDIEAAWREAHPRQGDGESLMPNLRVAERAEVEPLVEFGQGGKPDAPTVAGRVYLTLTIGEPRRLAGERAKKEARAVARRVRAVVANKATT